MANMNGGYVMIDLTGVDLSDLGVYDGAYELIKTAVNSGKPIVIGGLVNGSQEFSPIVSYGGEESSTSVFLSFFPITLHISNTDEISM